MTEETTLNDVDDFHEITEEDHFALQEWFTQASERFGKIVDVFCQEFDEQFETDANNMPRLTRNTLQVNLVNHWRRQEEFRNLLAFTMKEEGFPATSRVLH